MKIHIAVIDDRQDDRDQLKDHIRTYFSGKAKLSPAIRGFQSGEEMLEEFKPDMFQIAFLDICMDGISGIELARQLRDMDAGILIIFTTTSREFAFDAFPVHPFDYIVKPYTGERLYTVLDETLRVLASDEQEITLRVAHRSYQVPVRSIVSAVSQGHIVEVRTVSGQLLRCRMTFTEIHTLLEKDGRFLLCNRGVLINMDHVLTMDKDELRMNDGTSFTLRIRKRGELIKQFSQYQLSRIKRG